MDYIKPTSKEEPCSVLFNASTTGLDEHALLAARSTISSGRIKEWKPTNKNHMSIEPNTKYCYMDYDSAQNNIDPLLAASSCSKTDQTSPFHGVPFIKNVFEDSGYEETRHFPYKKCVLKIDENLINDTSLNTFWKGVMEMQCQTELRPLQAAISNWYNNLKACSATEGNLRRENSVLNHVAATNCNTIFTMKQELSNCQTATKTLQDLSLIHI